MSCDDKTNRSKDITVEVTPQKTTRKKTSEEKIIILKKGIFNILKFSTEFLKTVYTSKKEGVDINLIRCSDCTDIQSLTTFGQKNSFGENIPNLRKFLETNEKESQKITLESADSSLINFKEKIVDVLTSGKAGIEEKSDRKNLLFFNKYESQLKILVRNTVDNLNAQVIVSHIPNVSTESSKVKPSKDTYMRSLMLDWWKYLIALTIPIIFCFLTYRKIKSQLSKDYMKMNELIEIRKELDGLKESFNFKIIAFEKELEKLRLEIKAIKAFPVKNSETAQPISASDITASYNEPPKSEKSNKEILQYASKIDMGKTFSVDELSNRITEKTVFEIIYKENELTGRFKVIETPSNQRRILNSPKDYLDSVCDLGIIPTNPQSIKTDTEGTIQLDANNWKIFKNAVISFK